MGYFCKIVDNFGDIGVCWRLAKQLANEHNTSQHNRLSIQVTLYIDDFSVAQKLIPALENAKESTAIVADNVTIMHLNVANKADIANVTIETFACGLPEQYLNRIRAKQTCWVNLDYLSAEDWVADYHGKPSIHPNLNLTKYYFFLALMKVQAAYYGNRTLQRRAMHLMARAFCTIYRKHLTRHSMQMR